MRPILWRQEIAVLNGDLDHGIPTRIELQLCGPSDRDVPSADDPIVIVYSADDNPQLGDELRLPLAALKEFIESSADLLAPNLKKGEEEVSKSMFPATTSAELHCPACGTWMSVTLRRVGEVGFSRCVWVCSHPVMPATAGLPIVRVEIAGPSSPSSTSTSDGSPESTESRRGRSLTSSQEWAPFAESLADLQPVITNYALAFTSVFSRARFTASPGSTSAGQMIDELRETGLIPGLNRSAGAR